jgi:hypothetical protein
MIALAAQAMKAGVERWTEGIEVLRAAGKTVIFLLKVYPMLPSRPLDRITPRPMVEPFTYLTSHGLATGDLYRPASAGPYPGLVVCLGVVPFGIDHPQVPRLGEALARAGFAALLYWSPAMRDFRLTPADIGDIDRAYDALLARPDIDPARGGLFGTCVGGAFALMAAATPEIRDRVAFVGAYAPYTSMSTLTRDIASASRQRGNGREPWPVDQLTRRVFVHSLTALLTPDEAGRLRTAYLDSTGPLDSATLSPEGRALAPLLAGPTATEATAILRRLPTALQTRLEAMSPVRYLSAIRAPLVVLLHDRDDDVIPVSESRQLRAAFGDRAGVGYTEFTVFRHLDPTKGQPAPLALTRELVRFARAIYPLFRNATQRRPASEPEFIAFDTPISFQ